jgi:hypothetical protein
MYEQPAALARDWGHQRIYAPVSYRPARSMPLVPIVHTEVLNLAVLFPTCWVVANNGPTLCVLRSVLQDGSGIPGGNKGVLAAMPTALRVYPVVVPHQSDGEQSIVIDRAPADQPTDIGAPLIDADGRLTKAVVTRAQSALAAARALPATRAISKFLHESGLLEPWPLNFDLGNGARADVDNLMVLSRGRAGDALLSRAISRFGPEAALFFSAHWLSLFRISGLLSAARAAVGARANQSDEAA